MKLCKFCIENILESTEPWDYHHKSYTSLKESYQWDAEHQPIRKDNEKKKEHCLFCSTLHADIDKLKLGEQLKDPKYAAVWPICRWNIRSLAKIRESLETVVVTFRYVPPVSEVEMEGYEDVELPTRTFFFFPEENVQPLPSVSELGSSTNPADNGGHQIRSWLKTCDTTHQDCMKRRKATPPSERFVPTRLLDISSPPGRPIHVVETGKTSIDSPYCTLSHCWGHIPFVELRDSTRESFMKDGVPWRQFPKNFQEAIEIARVLEVRYIWIDSLCIIQKSNQDWKHEASRMHLVYRNSYCNIAIADSKDSTGGAFRKRNPEDLTPLRYRAKNDWPFFRSKTWVVVPENLWENELMHSSLYTRGWVFQERMLAPRILHFAHRQVFWDCPSMSACEVLPSGLPQPMDNVAGPDRHWRARLQEPEDSKEPLVGATDQSLGVFWKTAVQEYTSCNLTNGGDKLIAMWGIAKLVRDAAGIEYGDGLWEENLEDNLAWRVAECQPLDGRNLVPTIPTWSWASMNGIIIVPDRLTSDPRSSRYKVKDHKGRPLSFDLKGAKRVTRARTPVRGQSDSHADFSRHKEPLGEEEPGIVSRKTFPRSDSPELLDRNDQPVFHSKSIQIQGHVGQGQLEKDHIKDIWTLQVDGITDVEIEAFPDTMPEDKVDWARVRYFVVLSAKKVVIPSNLERANSNDTSTLENKSNRLAKIEEEDDIEDEDPEDEYVDYAGHGILLRDAGDHHFRRTGAFRFRNVSRKVFNRLQETEGCEKLPPELFHLGRGRKFWLD